MISKKKMYEKEEINRLYVDNMLNNMSEIYGNKSSDEYRMKGVITNSPVYDKIEYQIAQLSSIHGYPQNDATAIKEMFNVLHRPIFGKMVQEYLVKPDERNIIFTTTYTVGYRILVGELSRIITSSEATDKGFKYKPDKVSRNENAIAFIRKFNKDTEKKLDDMIIRAHKERTVQEAAVLAAMGEVAETVVGCIEIVFGFLGNIFRSAASMNPVALISAVLSRSYDKKIKEYDTISKEYELTKKAYDEYMKLPAAQRNKRVESKYIKMIDKYNIKMQNLKAKIDHYDLRAKQDADEVSTKKPNKTNNTTTKEESLPSASSTVDTSTNNDEFDF